MTKITQPHDRFLKALLSDPDKTGTLLRERLPKEVAELLSSEPPVLVDGTFIDGEFREHLTDRLFKVKTQEGKAAYIYALIEHKSYADEWVAFQLLRYMVRIWERFLKEGQQKLPPIVPLVVYHGAREWTVPNQFSALLEADKGLLHHLLDFSFAVTDLGRIADDDLSQDTHLRAALMAMKYAFQGAEGVVVIPQIGKGAQGDPEFAKLVLRYLIQTYRGMTMADVQAYAEEAFPGEAEHYASQFAREMMSKGRQEGRQEGRREGRQEGRQEGESSLLLRLLHRRFGDVPSWAELKVANATIDELETWGEQIFDAETLEAVFK
ncbi:conserved hypothetical protein [Magnetococcus marinus MC-1]|uniref:Transposase n=1 Tax=Magnetococcus marinus (strain ATCC BAA-1437 / JCM 17883 / MC-1) TaxID=156889 RepID=A0LBL3_MAGMM|nr:Rpn family recombination-promoting nuclease/putative transposase [Magnetococcus marinus]ABK45356.1 conserved hypothetical protein [Magnetococcus marinus MC-1]